MELNIPGYKIKRLIGKGGMARVFLAEQTVLEREVALKVMSKNLADDPTFGQRFLSEAKIVSKLVHPNIVTVHDMGEAEGAYFMAMEYVEGRELKEARQELSITQIVRVIADIARALAYASKKEVVHRDIKPENIMINAEDKRAVLMDFGIARAIKSDIRVTQTGVAIGTPHYMSPEQAKGKLVDHRSDLYSLGVVFYYLLVGRVPFDGDSAVTIGIKHISEAIPELPEKFALLQPIVHSLMAKRAEARYQSADDLLQDLKEIDVTAVHHAVQLAKTEDSSQQDDNLENLGTISSNAIPKVVDSNMSFEAAGDLASGFYETEDHVFGKRNPLWIWTFILIVAAGGVIYYLQPPFAKPAIASIEDFVSIWYAQALGWVKALLS